MPLSQHTKENRRRELWSQFEAEVESLNLSDFIEEWISSLENEDTRINYRRYITDLCRRGGFFTTYPGGDIVSLIDFRNWDHSASLRRIMMVDEWKLATKQARLCCYQSLCSYIEQETHGWFKKTKAPTYIDSPSSHICRKESLTIEEWNRFKRALYESNIRDYFMVLLVMEAPNIKAIVELQKGMIQATYGYINFHASGKSRKVVKVLYPHAFLKEIEQYAEKTESRRKGSPTIFLTSKGKRVARSRITYSVQHAQESAGLDKVISLYSLRNTWIDLRAQGISETVLLAPPVQE